MGQRYLQLVCLGWVLLDLTLYLDLAANWERSWHGDTPLEKRPSCTILTFSTKVRCRQFSVRRKELYSCISISKDTKDCFPCLRRVKLKDLVVISLFNEILCVNYPRGSSWIFSHRYRSFVSLNPATADIVGQPLRTKTRQKSDSPDLLNGLSNGGGRWPSDSARPWHCTFRASRMLHARL